jgi:hypothetical protein
VICKKNKSFALQRSAKDLVPQTELRDKITDFCKKHGIVMGNESATALEHPERGELGELEERGLHGYRMTSYDLYISLHIFTFCLEIVI